MIIIWNLIFMSKIINSTIFSNFIVTQVNINIVLANDIVIILISNYSSYLRFLEIDYFNITLLLF